MSGKIDNIIEELKTLTLFESSELVSRIEETFGVDASINNNSTSIPVLVDTPVEDVEEKTEFALVLDSVPSDKKIAVLKIVRSLTGLGLKEAKQLVESAPTKIQEGLNKENAQDAKNKIETVGGIVSLT